MARFGNVILILILVAAAKAQSTHLPVEEYSGNPVIRHIFTADPAALVYNDTFWLYTGHDEQAEGVEGYLMRNWHVFSSVDLITWHDHGAVLKVSDFAWARADAFAGQCVEKNGKFYWYVPMSHLSVNGFAIGVAVADHPAGPFTDARGSALITNDMTTDVSITWDDIDPSVFIDDDGQAYIFWGNTSLKWAKLLDNMTDLGSIIHYISLPLFTEAPWVHKRNGMYYLSYASGWPEYIDYATASGPEGPWTYRGRLNGYVSNSSTNHQSIVQYRNEWYFVYHNGALSTGGSFRRSVCIERLYYNEDGTISQIEQTSTGVPRVLSGEVLPEQAQDIFLYPNPLFGNELKIRIPEFQNGNLTDLSIIDVQGRIVFSRQFPAGTTNSLCLGIGPGYYLVKTSSGNSGKLIKMNN